MIAAAAPAAMTSATTSPTSTRARVDQGARAPFPRSPDDIVIIADAAGPAPPPAGSGGDKFDRYDPAVMLIVAGSGSRCRRPVTGRSRAPGGVVEVPATVSSAASTAGAVLLAAATSAFAS